ncbi:hypothetical protein T11_6613 [Trichinella zimbabwensis]|uniref:Uncharacterized protein n=1 Tax=Trichinella zimbabwensis TaxID=268475 RepID=A0A0V1HLE6_9BILA|nr:hypothetical protein T11_6613 [Trichinella zimbabwensis]
MTRKSGCNLCELGPSIGPFISDMNVNMGNFLHGAQHAQSALNIRGMCVPVIQRMSNFGEYFPLLFIRFADAL